MVKARITIDIDIPPPELVNRYLRARGWSECRVMANWIYFERQPGVCIDIPQGAGLPGYANHLLLSLEPLAALEGRPAYAVLQDIWALAD